jgi:hypothetical protein
MAKNKSLGLGIWFLAVFVVTSISAWATHVITCIETQQWMFLIAGAIAAPVGIVHGVGIWLGVW